MGLIGGLLLLPLAPVRSVTWLADRLIEQAEREESDTDVLRAALEELELARLSGEIDPEAAEIAEEALLARLMGADTEDSLVEEAENG